MMKGGKAKEERSASYGDDGSMAIDEGLVEISNNISMKLKRNCHWRKLKCLQWINDGRRLLAIVDGL